MTLVTEVQILEAAREQIKKGYTNEAYVGVRNGGVTDAASEDSFNKMLEKPNTRPVVCAIGGVEHALYSITGKFVTSSLRHQWFRVGTEYEGYGPLAKSEADMKRIRSESVALYAKCLHRLNKIAIDRGYTHLEAINVDCGLTPRESKPIILSIYKEAIKQARVEQDAQMDQELNSILKKVKNKISKKVAVPA